MQRCSSNAERMLFVSCGVVVETWAWVDTSKSKAEEIEGRTKVGCWRVVEGDGGEEMAVWMKIERRSEMGRV